MSGTNCHPCVSRQFPINSSRTFLAAFPNQVQCRDNNSTQQIARAKGIDAQNRLKFKPSLYVNDVSRSIRFY
jgi:hypothetical protein